MVRMVLAVFVIFLAVIGRDPVCRCWLQQEHAVIVSTSHGTYHAFAVCLVQSWQSVRGLVGFVIFDLKAQARSKACPFLNLIVGIFAYKSTNKNLAVLE